MPSSEESHQVQGRGGVIGYGWDAMAYKMTLPPDFPYGIEPETINDNSSTLDIFYKAIDIMASESQVLILINTGISLYLPSYYKKVYSKIMLKYDQLNLNIPFLVILI